MTGMWARWTSTYRKYFSNPDTDHDLDGKSASRDTAVADTGATPVSAAMTCEGHVFTDAHCRFDLGRGDGRAVKDRPRVGGYGE